MALEVNLELATCERSAWPKRQGPVLPLLSGAGVLKAEPRSLDHEAGATKEGLKYRRGWVLFVMGTWQEVDAVGLKRRECGG